MSRSTSKGPFAEIYNINHGQRVWSRRSLILPEFVGKHISVHTGNKFISLKITPQMAGHKFGEFAQTRVQPLHKKKNDNLCAF